MDPSEPPMERSDKRDFQSLLWALKPLINLSGSMPLPFVTTFLFVALDEGKGVNTYARAVGVHRSQCLEISTLSATAPGTADRALV